MRAATADNLMSVPDLEQVCLPGNPAPAAAAGATRWSRFELFAVLLVAIAVRLGDLTREGRHGDEYMQTSVYGSSSVRSVIHVARGHAQPPLDYLLGWGMTHISNSVAAMRFPAATFGVLGVWMTYALTARLAGRRAALFAAALLALSPLHVRMSQTARPYTIFVFAWLLTLWSMHAYLARPCRRRLLLFGFLASAMVWTNGLGPLVAVVAATAVAGAMWLSGRRSCPSGADAEHVVLGRLALTALAVGCLAIPLLLYLLSGAREWTSAGASAAGATLLRETPSFPQRLLAGARCWIDAWPTLFGEWGHFVLVLTAFGAGLIVTSWSQHPRATRAVWSTGAAAGLLFLVVFAVVVGNSVMRDRYGLFLVPLLAALAGIGAERLTFSMCRRVRLNSALAAGVVAGAVLVPSAWSAAIERGRYTNVDWSGSAAVLRQLVADADVVLVVEDRPLGEYQPPFWGKHDWPKDSPRPLGEAAWTLVTSPPHWDRLCRQTGRTFVALTRRVDHEGRDDYLRSGLQSPPPGWTLHKFRGLDLLVPGPQVAAGLPGVIEGCVAIAAVPFEHPDVHAIAHTLRARLLETRGESQAAQAARDAAWAALPAELRAWFAPLAGY